MWRRSFCSPRVNASEGRHERGCAESDDLFTSAGERCASQLRLPRNLLWDSRGVGCARTLQQYPWSALWMLLPGVVTHFYPVLLQRSTMLRLQPLLNRVGSR